MDQYRVVTADGKEFGPTDLAGLLQWIKEGRVLKTTRIRKNDGAVIAAEFLAELSDAFQQKPQESGAPPIAMTVPMMDTFRSWGFLGQAWDLVRQHWVPLGVMFLISGLLGAIPYIGPCISLIIGSTLTVGINRAILGMLAGRKPEIEMMFGAFDRFGQAFAAALVMGILVTLAFGLLIVPAVLLGGLGQAFPDSSVTVIFWIIAFCVMLVPGMYLTMMWMLTLLIIADTDKDFWAAMQESARLTQGYRWSLFCLCLAWIPIALLGLLALCIGIVVAQAVFATALALAYRFLQVKKAGVAPAR